MFQTKVLEKNQTTFYVQQPFPENLVVYEVIWKDMVQPDRPQMTI
jgi:hypothetical protein